MKIEFSKHWYFDEKRKIEGLISPTEEGVYYITLFDWVHGRSIDGYLSKYTRKILWYFAKQMANKAKIYICKENYRLF